MLLKDGCQTSISNIVQYQKIRKFREMFIFFMNFILYSIFLSHLNNNYITFQQFMCYLRNFTPIQNTMPTKETGFDQTSAEIQEYQNSSSEINIDLYSPTFLNSLQLFNKKANPLMNLYTLAFQNTLALQKLEMKIQESNQLLQNIKIHSDYETNTKTNEKVQVMTQESSQKSPYIGKKTSQTMVQKLFGGQEEYKYKLVLDEELPNLLYKERNFNFKVKLVDMNGNSVRNANIVHLCFGVCDVNAEWVTQTKVKEPLMKGKTEVQLYHGEAEFSKIYSRDVSRNYPEGKLNFVVYPKQSVLKYCDGSNSLESNIISKHVEPLVIKDISIKAKKKE